MYDKVAAVVLAGGKSSRMGENKSFMLYKGRNLIDIMIDKIKSVGITDVFVSGDIQGYNCLKDKAVHAGPAAAILDILTTLKEYDSILFVPVDTPLIKPEQLKYIIDQEQGCFYKEHFLPVSIPIKTYLSLNLEGFEYKNMSVKKFLNFLGVSSIPLSYEDEECFLNVNNPEEYKKLLSSKEVK